VLRIKKGDRVGLFNGRGAEATATVAARTRNSARLRIESSRIVTGDTGPEVVLATAVPKGDRFRWLVEKATELGVARLIPVSTARSVVEPKLGKVEKMHQAVVSACKQCGRSHLMKIAELTTWRNVVERGFTNNTVYVAHTAGRPMAKALADQTVSVDNAFVLAIGPEGGFSEEEVGLAVTAGATLVNLGPNVLRIETAAVAGVAYLRLAGLQSLPAHP